MLERYWDYTHNFMVSYVPAKRRKEKNKTAKS
jgi:hypothetical protein